MNSENIVSPESEISEEKEDELNHIEDAVNPCPPEGLDHDDNALLRGDAIGDTAYTHRWVLKCLMNIMKSLPKYLTKLKDPFDSNREKNEGDSPESRLTEQHATPEDECVQIQELSADVEDAACQLWDMTAERDVTLHLLDMDQVDVIQMTALICDQSTAPRLTEVMVGVIGNMCCQEEGCQKVLNECADILDSVIYLLGSSQDVPTLCEALRLLRLLIWHRVNRSDPSLLALCPLIKTLSTEYTRGVLSFLLNNSLSDALLSGLVELLSSVLFISLPETGLNLASLYSQQGMIRGLVEVCRQNVSSSESDTSEKSVIHNAILCLYAFIDTPGEKFLQSQECVSILEKVLPKYISREVLVDSPEELIGPPGDHLTQALGLCQLLVPYTGPSVTILYVGRLLSLIQGETHHYTYSRETSYEDEESTEDNPAFDIKERVKRQISNSRKGKRASIEGVSMMKIESAMQSISTIPEQDGNSSMLDIQNGWMSPPSLVDTPRASVNHKVPEFKSQEEKTEVVTAELKERLCSLEESLEAFCTQMVCWWWMPGQKKAFKGRKRRSSAAKKEKSFEPREALLSFLDQCHAHEVFYILDAVRRKDPALVPCIQEYLLDTGKHHRLVALLAHMYQ